MLRASQYLSGGDAESVLDACIKHAQGELTSLTHGLLGQFVNTHNTAQHRCLKQSSHAVTETLLRTTVTTVNLLC